MLGGAVRGALRGQAQFDGKAYFFRDAAYTRYDLGKDYGEVRYPLPLAEWGLPAPFASGIDATLDGEVPHSGKAYFFKGDRYVRYDWATERVDSELASIGAWGLTGAFAQGIDAALNGRSPHEGKAYFFKDDKYVRYSWADDRVETQPQPISEWRLSRGFEAGISGCLDHTPSIFGGTKAYFFKDDRYVRYDWGSDQADPGYPIPRSAAWPAGLAIWAEHVRAPLSICEDARLDAGDNRLIAYPGGTPRGQAGWQLGLRFSTLSRLADHMEAATIPGFYGDPDAGSATVPPGSVTRLAINAHGAPGEFDIRERVNDERGFLTRLTIPAFRVELERIGRMLAPGAPVLLAGCMAGRRDVGDELLSALSGVWAGHEVTAFTTLGYSEGGKQIRPGKGCDNPGMRDTDQTNPSASEAEQDARFGPIWENLDILPWAHERSRHSKSALDGVITNFDLDE